MKFHRTRQALAPGRYYTTKGRSVQLKGFNPEHGAS